MANGTLISPAVPSYTGVLSAPVAAAAQMYFRRSPGHVLRVINGSASPLTVTCVVNKSIDGLAVPNETVTVAAGTTQLISLDSNFEQPPGSTDPGYCYVNFGSTATITVELIQPPNY